MFDCPVDTCHERDQQGRDTVLPFCNIKVPKVPTEICTIPCKYVYFRWAGRNSIPLCSIRKIRGKPRIFLLSKYQKYQKSTKDSFCHVQEAGFFMSQQLLDDPG